MLNDGVRLNGHGNPTAAADTRSPREGEQARGGGAEETGPTEGTGNGAGAALGRRRLGGRQLPVALGLRSSRRPDIRMVPDKVVIDGRRIRFAVSNNTDAHGPEGEGSPPIWAVNVHGYFAGGGMYWRESEHLAETLGWRVLNPCLPGFAGSDALPWDQLSMSRIADQVGALLDHVGATHAVFLGHSMGGAVAVQFADTHPERTLGIVYRDGAATPAWKRRHGLIVSALGPFAPDIAAVVDIAAAVAIDMPDLLIGRRLSATLRGVWPDARRNIRAMGRTLPVGSMLMSLDLTDAVHRLGQGTIPVLPVWGCLDRVANSATADEFSRLIGEEILWVAGGHSWMLPRPQGQADVLRLLERGKGFVQRIHDRRRALLRRERAALRAVR